MSSPVLLLKQRTICRDPCRSRKVDVGEWSPSRQEWRWRRSWVHPSFQRPPSPLRMSKSALKRCGHSYFVCSPHSCSLVATILLWPTIPDISSSRATARACLGGGHGSGDGVVVTLSAECRFDIKARRVFYRKTPESKMVLGQFNVADIRSVTQSDDIPGEYVCCAARANIRCSRWRCRTACTTSVPRRRTSVCSGAQPCVVLRAFNCISFVSL